MAGAKDVVDRTAGALGWAGSVSPELDWAAVEGWVGTALPADYKEFMSRFPSGVFRDVVRILNPVQDRRWSAAFRSDADSMLIGVRSLWEEEGGYPPFPEPGGLIPFAGDVAGGSLCWLPWTADPDEWHVVHLSRSSYRTRTRRSMTAVMRELATSRSERNVLGWDLADTERTFEPF
ncbi:hypothetical protein FHX81_7397 [Saccharothrix saharensis]|uniref:Knr4/Smi1-like domain-containing protein n=1 Tax=Saccharothrix saharensis TaxID=571190 RepID=A0A543JPZ1_9PSEU|nr:SMI1/KNR4 family protein [Saccharothrix saharensis]TQM84931.1 hypothetical protein FHX81_7397 [Saccharothrix saharensis]